STRGVWSFSCGRGAGNALFITDRMWCRATLARSIAERRMSNGMPSCSFVSSWMAVMPAMVPATCQTDSQRVQRQAEGEAWRCWRCTARTACNVYLEVHVAVVVLHAQDVRQEQVVAGVVFGRD